MTTATSSFAQLFTVYTGGAVISTPVAKNIPNEFDYMGMLVGLSRLPGERNATYRERLWDVYVNQASSAEEGLINGISRELGLAKYEALVINTSGAEEPRIIVDNAEIRLYSSWKTRSSYVLEATIDIFSRDGDAFYLSDLITEINSTSHFTASLKSGVDEHTRSGCLLPADSYINVEESIYPMHRNILTYGNIVDKTVEFSFEGRDVYAFEKSTEAAVASDGDYYINYAEGIVYSYKLPTKDVTVRYVYRDFPLTLKASPIILHDFGSDSFREKVFRQMLQEDGTYEDGLPSPEALSYINECLTAVPMLWGPR